MESYIKTKYTEIWLQNGIIHVTYAPQIRVTLEIAKEAVQARLKISDGKIYPFYGDAVNIFAVDEEAKKYLSTGEAMQLISAGAFLINSPVLRMIGTTLLLFNRPPIPVKFFSSYEKAIQWLQNYKNIN